jgi:protein-S-isoprenylcysteine O-methyltransferase Ste14
MIHAMGLATRSLKVHRIGALLGTRSLPAFAAVALVPRLRRAEVVVPLAGLTAWTVGEALVEDEAANRAAVGSADDAGTKRLMVGAHLLAWWAPLLETAVRSRRRRSRRTFLPGLVLLASGGVLRLVAVRTLGRAFTGHVAVADDHALCDRGVYRWVRHPAYTGLLLLNVGPSIAAGSPASAGVVAATTLAATGRRVRAEERALGRALGERYTRYAQRTPRYLARPVRPGRARPRNEAWR